MDKQNLEKSAASVARLSAAVEELIAVVQQQRSDFSSSLAVERDKAAKAEAKIADLEEQIHSLTYDKEKLAADLNAAQNNSENEEKIAQLQSLADSRNSKINGLQTEVQNLNVALANRKNQLEEAENKNAEWAQKYEELEQKLAQMQQTITQTTDDIDDVVARLEKVLEENGASNNNN